MARPLPHPLGLNTWNQKSFVNTFLISFYSIFSWKSGTEELWLNELWTEIIHSFIRSRWKWLCSMFIGISYTAWWFVPISTKQYTCMGGGTGASHLTRNRVYNYSLSRVRMIVQFLLFSKKSSLGNLVNTRGSSKTYKTLLLNTNHIKLKEIFSFPCYFFHFISFHNQLSNCIIETETHSLIKV